MVSMSGGKKRKEIYIIESTEEWMSNRKKLKKKKIT